MSKRVTVMIDDDLDKKIRLEQANEITKTLDTCSYSKKLNDIVRKGLK